jgi:CRISPR-associated protein Cmr3
MFKYLIKINPLGLLYGSSGGFLSPENLVGRSQAKFPPDAATISGLFFSANKIKPFTTQEELRDNLYVAGAFWAKENNPKAFYVPIPWTKIIGENTTDEWVIKDEKWIRNNPEPEPDFQWQRINQWNQSASNLKSNLKSGESIAQTNKVWNFVSVLHPRMKNDERHVVESDGLFLENAVQMSDETCLIYLSTHELPSGWYRFGGENHLVEINSIELTENDAIMRQLNQPIERAFALISPAVWGSNRLSFRKPDHPDFPEVDKMLTDKAIPYRFRAGGRLGRGRYGVSAGSVYILKNPLNKTWWEWSEDWFPKEGYSLKKVGSGLCLPLTIQGL